MPETIEKVAERHTANEMMKRDGETYMAVGAFILALAIPVLLGTYWAMSRPRAAIVNAVCGGVLALIGIGALAYGRRIFRQSKKKPS